MKAKRYPGADTSRFYGSGRYSGVDQSDLDKIVLHSTETSARWGCPGYSGGASAPTFTINPWPGYEHVWECVARVTGPGDGLQQGLVMAAADWPAALAGLLVVPYLVSILPFHDVPDERCEVARRGWRRFLWLNMVTGFLLTLLLLWIAWGR